ncbi:MAG: DUF1569 domain-containing protein [Flavobacteriaceae bacterium]
MKSLFESTSHSEVLDRISNLSKASTSQWGQMEVGQMLHHCQFPLKLALGSYKMEKPNFVMRLLFKSFKKGMYNDTVWKHNLPTAKGFKVVDKKDFDTEKSNLIGEITDFHKEKDRENWEPHPAFGVFTHDQWGQMQYKHLDHHLRQFGV